MYREKANKELLQEIVDRGYGKVGSGGWQDRRDRSVEAVLRRKAPPGPESEESKSAHERGNHRTQYPTQEQIGPRVEDSIKIISPALRRRIDRYAFRGRYKITGLIERLAGIFSFARIASADRVSHRLIRSLVIGKGFLIVRPTDYCLVDNLDALYFSSRVLLGRSKQLSATKSDNKDGSRVEEALAQVQPFAFQLFSCFAVYDEKLMRSLAVLKIKYQYSARVAVADLARVVWSVYGLFLTACNTNEKVISVLGEVAVELHRRYNGNEKHQKIVATAAEMFRAAYANLVEFKHQLFPALLKMIGVFFPENQLERKGNIKQLHAFTGITEQDRLTTKGYTIRTVDDLSVRANEESEGGKADRADVAQIADSYKQRFGKILNILHYLFPESGIKNLDEWPIMLPYFDMKVFKQELSFPHQITRVSRFDPVGQVMILHRILDSMLTSLDGYTLDEIVGEGSRIERKLTGIIKAWQNVYQRLFETYLKELDEFVRVLKSETLDDERARSVGHNMKEKLVAIRSAAVRYYGRSTRVLESTKKRNIPMLYQLVERLHKLLAVAVERINEEASGAQDLAAVSLFRIFRTKSIVNFEANKHKTVIARIQTYIETCHRCSVAKVPIPAQIEFIQIVGETLALYKFLLGDKESIYHSVIESVGFAGDEEESQWEGLRKTLPVVSHPTRGTKEAIRNPATDLLRVGYWRDTFPEAFLELKEKLLPITCLYIAIDNVHRIGAARVRRQLGRRTLKMVSAAVLENLGRPWESRGYYEAVQIGESDILIILTLYYESGVMLAETLRLRQEEQVRKLLASAKSASQSQSGAKNRQTIGTLSIGVAQIERCRSVEEGARPHWVPIGPLQLWAERKLGDENIAYAIRAKIAKKGTKGAHMLKKAFTQTKGFMSQQERALGERIAKRLGGG